MLYIFTVSTLSDTYIAYVYACKHATKSYMSIGMRAYAPDGHVLQVNTFPLKYLHIILLCSLLHRAPQSVHSCALHQHKHVVTSQMAQVTHTYEYKQNSQY